MFLIKYLVLAVVLKNCDACSIMLFFSFPGKSHMILGEGYVRHLLDAGHDVTYITTEIINVQHPRLRQIDISENLKWFPAEAFSIESIMNNEIDLLDFGGAANFNYYFTNETLNMKVIQDLLMDPNETFDAVVVEWMYNELGAGLATVFDCPLIWSSSMVPHTVVMSLIDEYLNPAYTFHLHSQHRSFTFSERIHQLWEVLKIRYYLWSTHNKHEAIFRSIYEPALLKRGRTLPSYDDVRYNASMVLGNGNIVFSDPFPLPKKYKDIGGYHIIDDHTFAFATAHPNCVLFVTHAGLLSITEAIYFGVPVIGLPFFADQYNNINRVAELGFGKRGFIDLHSAGNLKEMASEVLNNPSYHQRAKELSAIYHHQLASPGEVLVFWIEYVIQSRGASHLQSNSMKVEWYKKLYLDVSAVILLAIITIVIMLKYLFRIPKSDAFKIKKMN